MSTPKPIPSFVFKIALIGNEGTGKTSLVNKFVQQKFDEDYKPTLGVSILSSKIDLESPKCVVNLILWDIAGQAKYQQIRKMYFQGCAGVIFVYDVTREPTYIDITTKWVTDFRQFSNSKIAYILVGNKHDLSEKVKVGTAMGYRVAAEIGALEFIETSAKTGENVNRMFNTLINHLVQKQLQNMASQPN